MLDLVLLGAMQDQQSGNGEVKNGAVVHQHTSTNTNGVEPRAMIAGCSCTHMQHMLSPQVLQGQQ
jgi:hypothetical protein